MAIELRPYQNEGIDRLRAEARAGRKRLLAVCPTGGGKTVVACEIIRAAAAKGSRALFLAHRRELIDQTSRKLKDFGIPHGVILAGRKAAPQEPVQVASVQTLANRAALDKVDLLFVDEAHHVTKKNSYASIIAGYPKALLVGLTATPWRLDGKGLAETFDGHVVISTPAKLRDDGWLVPVGGWEYVGINTDGLAIRQNDYAAGELERRAIASQIHGRVVDEWLAHANGLRTIVFACGVEHSQQLCHAFVEKGIKAEHIDGTMRTEERDALIERVRSGATTVVTNCNVLTEGFDAPELQCAILARPTLSETLYLQMVGRVLRTAPGKEEARIHDHARCLRTHGHPYDERDYTPAKDNRNKKAKARRDAPLQEMFCAGCGTKIESLPCEHCGFSMSRVPEMTAAQRRKIEEGMPRERKKSSPNERKEWWARSMLTDEHKERFFLKMVDKHGPLKAPRVYYWANGEQEQPRQEWVAMTREGLKLDGR